MTPIDLRTAAKAQLDQGCCAIIHAFSLTEAQIDPWTFHPDVQGRVRDLLVELLVLFRQNEVLPIDGYPARAANDETFQRFLSSVVARRKRHR